MTPDVKTILRMLASTQNKVGRTRDTTLEEIESPTAMLNRMIEEAKSKPMTSPAAQKWTSQAGEPAAPEVLGYKDFRSRFTGADGAFDSKAADDWALQEARKTLDEKRKFAFRVEGKEREIVRVEGSSMFDAKGNSWGTTAMAMGTGDDGFVIGRPPKAQRTAEDDAAAVVAAQQAINKPPVQNEPSRKSSWVDAAQAGLDAIGVADPTPISDGINAAWSIGRAFTDPERRGEHLQNAAISAVSMIPYLGDTAKLLKGGRYARTASRLAGSGDAATKAASRESYRETAESITGGGSGGGTGGSEPPPPPDGSDGDESQSSFVSAASAVSRFMVPVVQATAALTAAVKGLELFNSGIVALNRDLAPYNGQIGAAYASFEADEIQRNIRQGESKSGPLSALLEEQSELKDTIDKFTNPFQSLAIGVAAQLTKAVNYALKATVILEPILEGVQYIADLLGKEGSDATAVQEFFADVKDGKFGDAAPAFKDNGRPFRISGVKP
jgi:hypothetical protein